MRKHNSRSLLSHKIKLVDCLQKSEPARHKQALVTSNNEQQ